MSGLVIALQSLSAQPSRVQGDAVAREIDALARRAVAEGFVPALGAAVTLRGRTIYARSHGMADASTGRPVDDRTLWYIASTSKSLTGFAVALLAERGALRLDAPIAELLPEVVWPEGVDPRVLTLGHFLSHTHGLDDQAVVQSAAFTGAIPESQWPTLIRYARPGRVGELTYSNFGYNVAAMVIDRLRPEGWRQVLEREIQAPAGMRDTYARTSGVDPGRIAHAHTLRPDGSFAALPFEKTDATMNSAGGHLASLHDLARWTIVQMDSGRIDGRRVFPRTAVARSHRLIAPHTRAESRTMGYFSREGWAAGWDIGTYEGARMVSRFGGYTEFQSRLGFLPAHRVGAVVVASGGFANSVSNILMAYAFDAAMGRGDAFARAQERLDALRPRLTTARQNAATADSTRAARQRVPLNRPLSDFAGTYSNAALGAVVFRVRGPTLHFEWGVLSGPAEIFDASRNELRVEVAGTGSVVRYELPEMGPATALTLQGVTFRRTLP